MAIQMMNVCIRINNGHRIWIWIKLVITLTIARPTSKYLHGRPGGHFDPPDDARDKYIHMYSFIMAGV